MQPNMWQKNRGSLVCVCPAADFRFLSHAAHINAAGMDCKSCHGPIEETRTSRPYEEIDSPDVQPTYGEKYLGHQAGKSLGPHEKMNDCAVCHEKEKLAIKATASSATNRSHTQELKT